MLTLTAVHYRTRAPWIRGLRLYRTTGEDPARVVRVHVELGRDFVRITVVDDGHGFDTSRVPDPTLPHHVDRDCGRGLFVIRHLVDDVAFNEKGNGICLTLRAG